MIRRKTGQRSRVDIMSSRTTQARRGRTAPSRAGGGEATARAALFRALGQEAQAELKLCEAVEAMADRLPEICACCCRRIGAQLVRRAREEERTAGAVVIAELQADPHGETAALRSVLDQARLDRIDDQGVAFELSEALVQAAINGGRARSMALGYLMRNFFEGRRRRMAWETAALFEPAKLILSDAACARLFMRVSTAEYAGLGVGRSLAEPREGRSRHSRAYEPVRAPFWSETVFGAPPGPLSECPADRLIEPYAEPKGDCPRCAKE